MAAVGDLSRRGLLHARGRARRAAARRLLRYPYGGLRAVKRLLLWAAAGILADWLLKALLAPQWGLWLRALLPA